MFLSEVDPLIRAVLTGKGTVTATLASLCRGPVSVEIVSQKEILLSHDAADYLEVTAGQPALERKAWLTVGGEKMIYAHSLIPLLSLSRRMHQAIVNSKRPLGHILEESRRPALREKIRIGRLTDTAALSDLGLAGNERLWVRQSRLSIQGEFLASISEIFLPRMSVPR